MICNVACAVFSIIKYGFLLNVKCGSVPDASSGSTAIWQGVTALNVRV